MWFKVDDRLHASRKAAKAGVAAMGLWVMAGSWSAGEELDGFVPAYMVARLGGTLEMAEALVDAGLWVPEDHEGEAGFQFHAWGEYQPTRAQLEAKREDARERMARVRANKQRSDVRGSRSVTPTPTRPDPTKDNTAAADASAESFDRFWITYPRKVGKAAAAKAWAKAVKQASEADVMAGLTAAAAGWRGAGTDPQFIPHPATWLNQGRWQDEPQLPLAQDADRMPTPYDLPPLPPVPDGMSVAEELAWKQETRAAQVAEWQKRQGVPA